MTRPHRSVIAVTGASGYVGAEIARELEVEGHRIVRLGRGRKSGIDEIRWELGENSDPTHLLAERKVETLIHCAYDFERSGRAEFELNYLGTQNLIDSFRKSGGQRAILISTMSAFSGTRSNYGRTKLAIERLFSRENDLVLRLGLVYGDQPRGMVGAVSSLAERFRSFMPMVGAGDFDLHTLHVHDLCVAMRHLIRIDIRGLDGPPLGKPITLAYPVPLKFRDLVKLMCARLGRSPRLVGIPWQLIWLCLVMAQLMGVRGRLRADSLLGLVHHDRSPYFDIEFLDRLGLATQHDFAEWSRRTN